jgi:hypothetical protein
MAKNPKISKHVFKNIAHKTRSSVSKLWEYYSQYHQFLPMACTQSWKAMQEKSLRPIPMSLISVH